MPKLPDSDKKKETSAEVLIKAPADVRITVNGQAITRTRPEEVFATPTLQSGYTHSYTFRAEAVRDGQTVSRTQRISVRRGQRTQVDFTELAAAPPADSPAHVTVLLPEGARLWVDNVRVPSTSARRSFDTPKLKAGLTYYYTLQAEMNLGSEPRRESRRIHVAAGKQVTVDFRNLVQVQSASR